ncbi:MAG: hypothetical protein HQ510_01330 [Candidatus Marinimicrobia bacterium]|nr:hypothetical protein [Candidatus Neomarinimicrobiota bacterium]
MKYIRIPILILCLFKFALCQVSIESLSYALNGIPKKVFCTEENIFVSAGHTVIIFDSLLNPITEIRFTHSTKGLFVTDTLLFVTLPIGGAVAIYSISEIENPVELSYIEVNGEPKEILIEGNTAYVACGSAGVYIIDVNDPPVPQVTGNLIGFINAVDLQRTGNFLIVSDKSWGIRIFDLSLEDIPEVGNYARTSITSIKVQDTTLFAAGSGLSIINISDLTNPQLIHYYTDEFWLYACFGIEVIQNVLYVLHIFSFWNEFSWYDISDPYNIHQIGATILDYADGAADVFSASNTSLAYVNSNNIILRNASNPSSPLPMSRYNSGGIIYDMEVPQNTLFSTAIVACGGGALRFVDFSEPTNPSSYNYYIGNWETENDHIYSIAIDPDILEIGGNYAEKIYTGFYGFEPYYSGIGQLIQTSEGDLIQGLAGLPEAAMPEVLLVENDIGFITSYNGINIVEFVNNQMNLISEIDVDFNDLILDNQYLFGNDYHDFSVVSIENIFDPEVVGQVHFDQAIHCLTKKEEFVIIGTSDALHVVNVSNPSQPEVVSNYPLTYSAYDIETWGEYLIVANGSDGSLVMRLNPDQTLSLITEHETGGDVRKVAIQENTLFAGYASQEIEIVSLILVECIPGDISDDSQINIMDITLTVDCILENSTNCICADIDLNDQVDVVDIVFMVDIILNQ